MAHLTKERKIYLQIIQELPRSLLTGVNILFTNFTKLCVLCGFLFLSSSAWADIKFFSGHMTNIGGPIIGPIPNIQITKGGQIGELMIEIQGLPGGDTISLAIPGMSGVIMSDNQFLRRFTSVTMGKTTSNREVTGGGIPGRRTASITETNMSHITKINNSESVDPITGGVPTLTVTAMSNITKSSIHKGPEGSERIFEEERWINSSDVNPITGASATRTETTIITKSSRTEGPEGYRYQRLEEYLRRWTRH